jgi:amino acid adenylation domain-containing protein
MSTIHMTVGARKISAGRDPEAHRFWTGLVADAPALMLRPDDPAAGQDGTLVRLKRQTVPASLDERIRKGTRNDATSFEMFVLSMTAALVARCEGVEDGILWLHQHPTGGQGLLLPCRFALGETDTLQSLLARMSATGANMVRFRSYPHDILAPGPQIAVAVRHDETMPDIAPNLSLLVVYRRLDDRAFIEVHAPAGRYSADAALRFCDRFVQLAKSAIEAPQAPLGSFDLRTEADRHLIDAVNRTATDIGVSSLTALFDKTFDRLSAETAIITPDASYSYAELEAASRAVASELLEAGLGESPLVAVLAHRSFETLAAIIGILRAGGAYLPVDPGLPIERLHYILTDSSAGAVLCQEAHRDLMPEGMVILDLTARSGTVRTRSELPDVAPDAAAYLIYTSGSTGRPKGVLVEHDSVVNRLKWMQLAYPISASDRLIQKTPLTFDVSVWELFWWLIEGATLVVPAPGVEKEPAALTNLIHLHGVTTMHFVPTMLGVFLSYLRQVSETDRVAPLRQVFTSGEALQPHHAAEFLQELPSTRLINLYGPTEATVDVSHFEVTEHAAVIPIGRPIANTGLHVLGHGQVPCGVGMTGELYLSGRGIARGYVNKPDLTRERFLDIPGVAAGRLYRTGDLARWREDGTVEYLGRNDFQTKLRGFRIELGEIESQLVLVPGVSDAVALVAVGKDEQQHLRAYVVGPADLTEAALKTHLARSLPDYMVPERILRLDAFPLSQNGKLDRKALPEPDTQRGAYVAPETPAETTLAEIWETVLQIDRIGVTDNFFALGGNSIHFVSVLAAARTKGLTFSFQQLFRHPTIRELVTCAASSAPEDVSPQEVGPFDLLSPEERTHIPDGIVDAYPMSMLQAGLIFQSEIMHGNTSYHDIVSYLIQGEMDPALFTEAVRILVRENPILRTSYQLRAHDRYLQYVHAEVDELPLVIEDLRGRVAEADWNSWYARWFEAEQNRAFDWSRPGLVRLHVHILADDLFRYSISQHNSMLDGWSMNQVHVKLFDIFLRLRDGLPYVSEGVNTHLRNFIGLERQAIGSQEFKDFWQTYLENAPQTDVPRLRPPVPDEAIKVTFRDVDLPEGLSDAVIDLARTLNVPVKTVLLAAHLRVLATLSGQSDVFTGYEIGGRPELPGAEKALGVFLNTMPLRVDLKPGSWRDLILQVFEVEAQVLPYRRYPMAQVKQDRATTNLLFETVFNFTHFYSLKELKKMPEFSLLDVRAAAITEFPLRIEVSQHFYTDEVHVSLHYHTASFDESQILRIGGYFVAALTAMTRETGAAHHGATLISDAEQAELAAFRQDGIEIVDSFGQPVPVGSFGTTHPGGQRARRMPDGTLEQTPARTEDAVEPVAPTAEPMTQAEAEMAALWAEVLKKPVGAFDPSSDFFEVGGNSLLALRLMLKLGNRLALRDLMQNSRLREMATRTARPPAGPEDLGLLVPLTGASRPGGPMLVCLPYAGGDAGHFRPFGRALEALLPDMTVLGADLPGHGFGPARGQLVDFEPTVAALANAILAHKPGPLYIWGHCVGSALALALAETLGRRGGVDLRHVFIAAKLLPDPAEIAETLQNARDLSFADIRLLYREWAGADDLTNVGAAFEDFLVSVFRHDSLQSNGFLLSRLQQGRPCAVDVPVTLVLAANDPATDRYDPAVNSWAPLVPALSTQVLSGGGHYFLRSNADEAARVVQTVLAPACVN